MAKKIRVGVFGGARGHTMINVLFDHPDAELVAVCDKYTPLLDRVKKEAEEHSINVATFENFEDFFNYDMDAVVLANYANEHAQYAIRLLRSGRHVMSEVLPSETMAQAVELIEAVEESGKVYTYAENYCYMNSTFDMWRRYLRGDIGEVMYAEGEYIHDCSSIWPGITYGERDHWRNRLHANFYNTHSLGPIMMITGRRPVSVVGFELPVKKRHGEVGHWHTAGVEMVTVDNGAVFKSVHGCLVREPGSFLTRVFGQKGSMESSPAFFWPDGKTPNIPNQHVWIEGEKLCRGEWDHYFPTQEIEKDFAEKFNGHGGADFYATHFFIEKILKNPEADKWAIDVYRAIDMGSCGILAYRSSLSGSVPIAVPDLRDKAQRDAYRNDNACTNPEVAGDQLLPLSKFDYPPIPDEVYEKVRQTWLAVKNAE